MTKNDSGEALEEDLNDDQLHSEQRHEQPRLACGAGYDCYHAARP